MFVLVAALTGSAHASAVAGCTYEAEVIEVVKRGKDISLKVKATKVEPFGHSGRPPECEEVGSTFTFDIDNDGDVDKKGVKAGSTVKLEEMEVWNITAKGHHHSHTRKLL